MKLDPGMHIVMHLVFFGKTGVTRHRSALPYVVSALVAGHRGRHRWPSPPAGGPLLSTLAPLRVEGDRSREEPFSFCFHNGKWM
jgi:hypothetical protein